LRSGSGWTFHDRHSRVGSRRRRAMHHRAPVMRGYRLYGVVCARRANVNCRATTDTADNFRIDSVKMMTYLSINPRGDLQRWRRKTTINWPSASRANC
jgi:hypothetical protein